MFAISSSIRLVVARSASVRAFSSCEPAERLKGIFEAYRQENYSRESPSRFKKELIKALGSPSSSAIEIDSLNQMLINIGRPDERLSENDLDLLLKEAGVNDQRSIPVEKFVQLM